MNKLIASALVLALLAAALAAPPVHAAPAGSPAVGPEVNWWVIGGGGGAAGGGSITLNDSLGQPVTGPASAPGLALSAGFWQAPNSPAAVPGLRGSRVSGHVQLDWTPVTTDINGGLLGEVTYRVYRAVDTPYFTPGAPPYVAVTAGTTYTDPDLGVIGSTAHATYYLVTAVSGGLESVPSNRTGVVAYRLVPGN